jgi:Tfp pilus assembly protein PilF
LLGVGQKLMASKIDDAMTLLRLNIEFNPESSKSYMALAYGYTRKLDDASAITTLEKALEIDPGNNIARGQLEQLKQFRRKK